MSGCWRVHLLLCSYSNIPRAIPGIIHGAEFIGESCRAWYVYFVHFMNIWYVSCCLLSCLFACWLCRMIDNGWSVIWRYLWCQGHWSWGQEVWKRCVLLAINRWLIHCIDRSTGMQLISSPPWLHLCWSLWHPRDCRFFWIPCSVAVNIVSVLARLKQSSRCYFPRPV